MSSKDVVNREPEAVSHFATGLSVIKGEVTSVSDIRIDGDFDGRISCKERVIVGENANLKGDVICKILDVYGNFEGNAIVGDTFSLKKNSNAKGSFRINKLFVEIDSCFEGETKMITDEDFCKLCDEDSFMKDFGPVSKSGSSSV